MSDNKHEVNVDYSGLKEGESFRIDRDSKGNVTRITKEKKACWIATAYYGDSLHPNVCQIRDKRDYIIHSSALGGVIEYINDIYQKIGRSKFGQQWIHSVTTDYSGIPRKITGIVVQILLLISK